ncbi:unnamed protein product [Adineta ricciae]|uniref:[heparan sulfate]-glucosamine N-sulfotransferase n=1 Tax=Adineta ricciae TaxID=249248 RepID=A0A814KI58_ADIRI|nr:unnamed protein product [Adineta ricciae]
MVRCTLKRAIKALSFCLIFVIICTYYSSQSVPNKNFLQRKSLSIFILSSTRSKTIQRISLFFNELRLNYVEYRRIDEHFYENVKTLLPRLIILDYHPDENLRSVINQYEIKLLILLNAQCTDCTKVSYSEMLFENVSYPTMDFNRDVLKPVIHTTKSPFRLVQHNKIIQILRFDTVLPYFHHQQFERKTKCFVFRTTDNHRTDTIVYVHSRTSSEKLKLLFEYHEKQLYLSECLFDYWFIWPVMMDIVRYLTSNEYDYHGLKRYVQVDIDDIFLGDKSNGYLISDDIQALIRSQLFIQNYIENFRYRLGFSGYYYSNSTNEHANEANRLLMTGKTVLDEKDRFTWFHHTWKHEKLTNVTNKILLISSTETNMAFAQKHQLPLDENYAVAPHHSGIYPINHIVYDVWHRFFNFTVTSTENYPYHYQLPSDRRGFIYRNISVLPRRSCGLYTTTRNYTTYPNGSHRLERILMGGRLFRTILTNPISIFMSHNVNYGHDRMGNYVFAKLVYLISKWTNIQWSRDLSSSELARKYFHHFYPEEQMPIFTNPCSDRILMNLWNGNDSLCTTFPQFIIVGPQKTGTTALHAMLSQHPDLRPSRAISTTFEEVQFFSNNTIYLNGINWYLNQFDPDEQSMNFEKSATYFDSAVSIKRLKALLPNIRLIMMLTEPGHRAYSRYQVRCQQ